LIVLTLAMMFSLAALAGTKDSGKTSLKDVQPAGTPANKQKQQYDLLFTSVSGKDYTCRTSEKKTFKATEFVVGESMTYEVKDNKGKLKASNGKQVECTIVRVANAPAATK